MRGKIFVDTNILVYCFDSADPTKKKRANQVVEQLWEGSNGVLSLQVLKEFFVTVTGKLATKMTFRDARAAVLDLLSWDIFYENRASLEKTFEIFQRHHLSFWDANILSSAILSGCDRIYSEDLQHSRTIEDVKILNPFLINGG
ncbi:MAG: PIN domain-containing protein [Nitrospirae bacterium]|nr:PIN domain-containing protein [Nitrospirota bacterium]